ncbi:HAD family hydrolase [Pseudomonadales bacterium]|nr:HAD family hydrolase [Pseudomonadales bacterium]
MKAVFLDRDGVINRAMVRDRKPYPPANLSELEILPKVDPALKKLHEYGYKLIVVSNQPDVARGTIEMATVEEINTFLHHHLPIDDFFCCFHDNSDNCECRKPKPGSIFAAAKKYDIDLAKSFMVGDRWRDMEAGVSAGCKTIFLDYGYDEKQPVYFDYCVASLYEASIIISGVDNE